MPARPRCQFSLLAVMGAMVLVAVVLVNWTEILMLMSLGIHLTTVTVAMAGVLAGNRMRLAGMRWSRRGWLRWLSFGLLAFFVSAAVAAYWTAWRWELSIEADSSNWPLPLPYPDKLLNAYFYWVYEWNPPADDGQSTLESAQTAFQIVLVSLYGLFWLFVGLAAFQAGQVFKTRELLYLFRPPRRPPRPPEIIS